MTRLIILLLTVAMSIALQAQSVYPDFTKMNFGCDGNSITAGQQWSKTVVDVLGFATHHNVAVGSATWACHADTQDYGSEGFAGISGGWQPTEDKTEIQMRHNNVAKVHIQRFIDEVDKGLYPVPDVFVFAMGTNDSNLGSAEEALKGKTLDEVDVTTMAGGARWAIQQLCQALSVQLIDCYSNAGITEKFEQPSGRGRYLKDGLHPDVEGQQLMGRYIAKEIRNNFF